MLLVPILLAGCGGASLWPFGGGTELSRKPANATEYLCETGKSFFVRDQGADAVWLIAPDRQIRLDKLPGTEAGRYGVGKIVLEIRGDNTTLFDPPAQYVGCKRAP